MSRNVIRSIRKGSVQWNEEDRLKVNAVIKGGIFSPDRKDCSRCR